LIESLLSEWGAISCLPDGQKMMVPFGNIVGVE
jgi:hypothetical protein